MCCIKKDIELIEECEFINEYFFDGKNFNKKIFFLLTNLV